MNDVMHTKLFFLASMVSFSIAMFSTGVIQAQNFPSIKTTQPDGEVIDVPQDLDGKKSIIFLAFTADAEGMLDNWYAPVYTMFIDESGINALAYDCHVKLVMMFTGLGQSLADQVMEKITENVDESMNDYLLFYEGDFRDQMKALSLRKKDDAYVFVLDESGKIIFQDSGGYSESKLEKIASLVEL